MVLEGGVVVLEGGVVVFKEAWWSWGSVPVAGPLGSGSNLGPGPTHSVV